MKLVKTSWKPLFFHFLDVELATSSYLMDRGESGSLLLETLLCLVFVELFMTLGTYLPRWNVIFT